MILDVQQIVPLPEAQDYQVRLRERRERQREAQRSMRDYTRYDFGDQLNLPKRRLALEIVRRYCSDKGLASLEALQQAFPDQIRNGQATVQPLEYALERANRFFLEEDEILTLPSGERAAVSNQWNHSAILNLIKIAEEAGYGVTPRAPG